MRTLACLCFGVIACGPHGEAIPDGGFISYQGDATAEGATDGAIDGPPSFYPLPDGGTIAADRFITSVVSFMPGPCAGFGQAEMPTVVEGPPVGGGTSEGSTDVVSLGVGGTIVVSFAPNAIIDGPGVDFVVFENPFWIGGNPNDVYAEPGTVSVSDDGVTWTSYPCTATVQDPPYGSCAGWTPVMSAPGNSISPVDYPACGGNGFDLADIGVTHVRFVKIVDHSGEVCPSDPAQQPKMDGFDLDAISIINAETP
jgi:hypothetical protein